MVQGVSKIDYNQVNQLDRELLLATAKEAVRGAAHEELREAERLEQMGLLLDAAEDGKINAQFDGHAGPHNLKVLRALWLQTGMQKPIPNCC